MAKIVDNGVIRPMTDEENAMMEQLAAELPPLEPTPEELIAQQAQEIAYLREALELILSGVTEVSDNG